MDKLSLPESDTLKVHEPDMQGTGDISRLYIQPSNLKADFKIWNYITVEDSPMGAWQAYLLDNAYHLMPSYWHGGYSMEYPLYADEDYEKIQFIRESIEEGVKDSLIVKLKEERLDLIPRVTRNGNSYQVSACYWSDFRGLIRESLNITILNNKVSEFIKMKEEILHQYWCEIMF